MKDRSRASSSIDVTSAVMARLGHVPVDRRARRRESSRLWARRSAIALLFVGLLALGLQVKQWSGQSRRADEVLVPETIGRTLSRDRESLRTSVRALRTLLSAPAAPRSLSPAPSESDAGPGSAVTRPIESHSPPRSGPASSFDLARLEPIA